MWGYVVGGFVAAMVVPAVVKVGSKALWQAVRPKIMGYIGEKKVDKCLRKFKGKGFAQIKDVMLPTRNGTSQIDNMLVSQQGIFVIETKNYSGRVFGDEISPKWVQISPNGFQREFPNPILQNNGHIWALQSLLGKSFSNAPFYNIVVFGDKCKVSPVRGVFKMKELKKVLKELTKGAPVLTEKEVTDIKDCIENRHIKGRTQRSQHVKYAKRTANKAKEREASEARRLRAMANKDMAMKVQNLYSDGLVGVDTAIANAEKMAAKPTQTVNNVRENFDKDR